MPLDRAVLEEADMDAAADGHHETTGKWTKPCNTWPFKWPFSPCKEPPGQASTAPTYALGTGLKGHVDERNL